MSDFRLGADVHQNVGNLLAALGSATRPLSYGDLARMLNEADAVRRRYPATVQRWIEGTVPDFASIKVMSQLAGVTFEEFALGAPSERGATPGGVGEYERRAIPAERPSAKKAAEKGRRRA